MSVIEMPAAPGRGRAVKFTPERIEQIKNLVERGTPREQIAEIIGVTVGSLQVTCSRLGISLRQRRPENGIGTAPAKKANSVPVAAPANAPASFSLVMECGGRSRTIPLNLPSNVVTCIALEASIRGISIAEYMVELLLKATSSRD